MVTIERPAVGETSRRTRRRGLLVVVAVVVLAVVGIVVWVMASGDGDRTPIERVQDLAAAMRDDDVDEVNELLGFVPQETDQEFRSFLVWSMALEAEPTFSDCTSMAYGFHADEKVTCTVTYGDDFFYSRVLGETLTSTFEAYVFDDYVADDIDDWIGVAEVGTPVGETPDGVLAVEAEFRSWVGAREDRWELDDQLMLGPLYPQDEGRHFTTRVAGDYASGELRMELLDEFMDSR